MEADGGLPGPDKPVPAEIVHESGRTRVTRLFLPGGTVIRKEPLGPHAERRVRHEVAMLERLRGVAGVAQLAEAPQQPGSVMLADAGRTSLADAAKPVAVDELTGLAMGLGRAVAGIHRRGVMHRDITPANVVLSGDGSPCLVDFALANSFAEIRPEFTHHAQIAGTLAYLAPEATGRTGRPADQRADLYALGATLYELATGAPPFGSDDPLRLIHEHMARAPAPPAQVNPAVPAPLSAMIMHLLEKEPDNRYQTADGLVYDLARLRGAQARPAAAALRVGEHDVQARLFPPSRLAGRDDEVAALEAAFADALAGRCRGVLVGGTPGVGKTALVDQLRPAVTGTDGWFVAGKFDQFRRDLEFDAVNQAFRALGRLLLAEPEEELAPLRMRITAAAGPNAGLLAAVLPEFAALLGTPPDAGDPLTAQARIQRAGLAVLRAVASRKRPAVLFLDDLQWAGRTPLGLVDLLLSEEPADGLLLVGAYREGDLNAAHPLMAPLSRWRQQAAVRHLVLGNLPGPALAAMVAEMLRVDPASAAGLAGVIGPHTRGNPYETVELLGRLRRDGLLTATAAGWRWDEAAIRAHLEHSEVAGLLAARAAALPPASRQMLEAMACLGGRAELSLLQAAAGDPAGAVDQALAPALEEGLLVAEPGAHPAVRFRHDRIREAVLGTLEPRRRRALQLAMARRLAAVPELFASAAEQYLPAVGAVTAAAERRQVAGLLRRAAGQATLTGDYALANALLTAALPAVDPGETATLAAVHADRHAALYSLGRLEEADEEYRTIGMLCPAAADRAHATEVQVRSMTHRTRFAEALRLGLESLRELGISVPAADQLAAGLDHQFGYLYQWLDHTEPADDLARPDLTDPALLAASSLINATQSAAYVVGDQDTVAWLGLEALRICLEHGPAPALVGPATYTAFGAVTLRGDYAAGYRAARRILALSEARGYEPGTSQVRMLFAFLSCWAEPIENSVNMGQRVREGLIAGGDLADVGYTYCASLPGMLDCVPLERYLAEAEAAVAFVRRTGSEQSAQVLGPYRWLADVLLGESTTAAGEAVPADKYAGNPVAQIFAHLGQATAAAIFGDQAGLERHTVAAMPLVPVLPGLYPTAIARLLRGLALAGQARSADGEEQAGLLAELDEVTRWLAARAADAPDNFLHLVRLAEAERAWAAGDFRAAALAFDAARGEAAQRQRPWHRALIAEHAARFYLTRGLDHTGHDLLAQARQEYLAWGATAKVGQLDWAYPALRPAPDATASDALVRPADLPDRRSTVTAGTIDLLGIVSASQALSSETSIGRLHARVAEVLSAMTGATGVRLLLWNKDRHGWLLPAPDADGGTVPVSGAGHERAAPMSVLRYARRTREPLVVADAAGDDRFARDPYFAGIGCCSLLAVPILSRGTLKAVLLLENRLLRGAFTAGRLEAVNLIAGQLAVSLDNAQVYTGFRRIADEQTALRRVATVVARAAPSQEVFAAVIAEAGRVLGVDRAYLVRYDPSDTLELVGTWSSTGAPPPTPVGTLLPLGGRNVTTLVWQTARPARIEYDDAISGTIGRFAAGDEGLRSSVGVPVSVEGQLWGAIVVAYTGGELLPADTEARLAGFTELVATAVANTQARMELRRFADEQSALQRVATLVAQGVQPVEVFSAVSNEASGLFGSGAAVLRFDHDGPAVVFVGVSSGLGIPVGTRWEFRDGMASAEVYRTGCAARVDAMDWSSASGPLAATARRLGVVSTVCSPIVVQSRLWGTITLSSMDQLLPTDTEERLGKFTELVATAIANAETQAALAASRARIVATADQTRRRIERNLHDGVQQRLVILALMLSSIRGRVPADVRADVDEVRNELATTRQELRDLCQGVHPSILAEAGLGAAVRALARRSPLPVRVQMRVNGKLPGSCEVTAYYVAAEAFTNAAKHARASAVDILIEEADGTLTVQVRDDGIGGASASRGSGLTGLRDRVEAVGGSMTLNSAPGAGTVLTVLLPVTTDDH
jgi:predicted ATPase/signal transduction histidine kinase